MVHQVVMQIRLWPWFRSSNTSKIRIGNSVCENCTITYLKFNVKTTDIFLEEEIIHFFWYVKYWNWLCHQFWFHKMFNEKNTYLKYNVNMEEGALAKKGKIYQQDAFSWCIHGRLKLFGVIIIKSHNTCTNELASSIVFECLSPSCCAGSS